MMQVDSSVKSGQATLLALADQLPPGMSTGRPMVITSDSTVMTADGPITNLFEVDADGRGASRIARLGDGTPEVTTWRHRVETGRWIVRDDGPDDGGGGGGGDGPEGGPGPHAGPSGADDPEFAVLPSVRVVRGDVAG